MGKSCTGLRIRQGSRCGVEDPADLQAHIIAALLAFRLTLTLFLSSLLLPCLFADSSLPLAFPCKVGFHFIGLSEDAVHVIRCNFQTPGFFSQGAYAFFLSAISLVSSSFRFSKISAMVAFHHFLLGNISRILHRHPIPWNALHGIFLKNRLRKLLLDIFCRKILPRIMNLFIGFVQFILCL